MDWEGLREKTLGEVANTLVTEGVGVGAGFIGASTVGRRIEDYMIPAGITAADPFMTKVKGWVYNNIPKLAAWYLIRSKVPETAETRTQEMLVDAKKAIAGSVVFDTLLRVTNHGVPVHDPGSYKLLGGKGEAIRTAAPQADIQRLIQENSALRTELNKALQRLSTPTTPVQTYSQAATLPTVQAQASQPAQVRTVQTQPVANVAPVVRYQPAPYMGQGPMPVRKVEAQSPVIRVEHQSPPVVRIEKQEPIPPAVSERQRKFAFMPTYHAPPAVQERERKYGFAGRANEKEIATMFGML